MLVLDKTTNAKTCHIYCIYFAKIAKCTNGYASLVAKGESAPSQGALCWKHRPMNTSLSANTGKDSGLRRGKSSRNNMRAESACVLLINVFVVLLLTESFKKIKYKTDEYNKIRDKFLFSHISWITKKGRISHLESLLITLMSAPFSSFSLMLSALRFSNIFSSSRVSARPRSKFLSFRFSTFSKALLLNDDVEVEEAVLWLFFWFFSNCVLSSAISLSTRPNFMRSLSFSCFSSS